MLAVTKVKMSGSEKKKDQEQVRHFHHKTCNRVTEVSLEVSPRSRAKERRRTVQKVCCTCKDAFLLIRPIVVLFTVLVAFAA